MAGTRYIRRLLRKYTDAAAVIGVFLLPLVCWPGLGRPFSLPKLWLLAAVALLLALRVRPLPWPWLLWPAALAVSALTAPFVSLEALLIAALALPLYWAPRESRAAVVVASLAESVVALLQAARLDPFAWFGWRPEAFSSSRMRVYGTLGNPDFVAAWLSAALPLSFALKGWKRTAAVAIQFAAVLATGSRIFVPALAAAAAAALLSSAHPRKRWLTALPMAAAVVWLSPARPLTATLEGRLYLGRITAAHWSEVPLAGFGPGSFPMKFAPWQIEWLTEHPGGIRFAGAANHAHNDYLELWVEYGPLGFGALLALSGWLLVRAWRRRRENPAAWSALAALLAVAAFDFPLHRPAEWGLYWLLLGMVSSPGALEKRRNEECRFG